MRSANCELYEHFTLANVLTYSASCGFLSLNDFYLYLYFKKFKMFQKYFLTFCLVQETYDMINQVNVTNFHFDFENAIPVNFFKN